MEKFYDQHLQESKRENGFVGAASTNPFACAKLFGLYRVYETHVGFVVNCIRR